MKNHRIRAAVLLSGLFLTLSCSKDPDIYVDIDVENQVLIDQINSVSSTVGLQLLRDNSLASIPQDPKNPITQAKIDLGKLLFHETGLALDPKQSEGMGTYSCASCHQSKAGFQSGMKQGIGEGGSGFGLFGEARIMDSNYDEALIDVQPIRSPTILNTAFQDVMLWNGQFGGTKTNAGTEAEWTAGTPKATNNLGFEGVETQAIAGSDVHRLKFDPEMIQNNATYKKLFDEAYPNIQETERYTKLYGALAIAAYERTVVASEAPFQKWLHGENDAMNELEKKGALLFFGKGKCYTCHSGPGLNGMEFHALGMNDLSGDDIHGIVDEGTKKGRGGFTKNPDDDYKFKTPTLYNLKDVKFLGHGGSFTSVKEVIEYKNKAVAENSDVPSNRLSNQFTALGLTTEEIDQLVAFVEDGLHDNNLDRYVPESLPTGQCFPNADAASKSDMGCD
ncbi:cytochrome-c peroxidase [Maribacter sp. 2308TA10-17]|uniref:cytochrome-c peroxidase n=1 Tax=Maribacter sp. 2308TA10-17 TaxID=3386276 RepID=UPI0039BD6192